MTSPTPRWRELSKCPDCAGAFYKYFTDLTAAYRYLYQFAMNDLHDDSIRTHRLLTAEEYVAQVTAFLEQVTASPYYELIQRHYAVNEALLHTQAVPRLRPTARRVGSNGA